MSRKQDNFGISTDIEVIDRLLAVQGKFLVEAGCGNMHLSRKLAERGASVLALDPDPIQAEKNRQMETISNVGFHEGGAESIPVEPNSVDGVLFPYSLHHVPATLYPAVFEELLRILKPDGFIYAIEPVADGDLNDVMRLFHDEQEVRTGAQHALETLAIPHFKQTTEVHYKVALKYESWEQYAGRFASKSFNANYTKEDVWAEQVHQKFLSVGEAKEFAFESPIKVTYLQGVALPLPA